MPKVHRAPSGHRCGESQHKAKACDATVRKARELRQVKGWSYNRIGRRLGVHWRTVADWCKYETRLNA